MPVEKNDENPTVLRETTERFWLLRLVRDVREDGIYVRLEPLQRSFRRIHPEDIVDVNVTTYAAKSYAGWHWEVNRTPDGNTVYRLRGDRGVEIRLENGNRWFIGSRRPESLESAIGQIINATGNRRDAAR